MPDSSLRNVHKWLVSKGFVHIAKETRHYVYEGSIQCNQVEVPIRISFQDLSFQRLPDIYLREPRPQPLRCPLPHVDHRGKLCYLEAESYRADPYHPVKTVATVLERASKVLIGSLNGSNSDDVGYEFGSYWEAVDHGVILSNNQSGHVTRYNRIEYESPAGNSHHQLVVGSDKEIDAYNLWREGDLKYPENRNALWVRVGSTALLPEKGAWPPKNFHSFHEWLKKMDSSAAHSLRQGVGTKAGAQSPLLIILETRGGFVSVEVALPSAMITATKDPGRFRKQLLSDKGRFGTSFIRGVLDDFSPRFQTTRNLVGVGLSRKRIVIVGCGTIGGYLSRLLVQSGCGQGAGELVLYDGQVLTPGNIGRHYLDGSYLYENKAESCKHKLNVEYPSARIRAEPKDLTCIEYIRYADIVIDATGREPFSLSLNAQVIQRFHANKPCPPVLYVWLDGNGYCGRTLYYDGSGGCYRCLQDLSGAERFEPLVSKQDITPISYKCGESFFPYPPSASVQVAGMGLDAILDWVNGGVGHTFRHRPFHRRARKHNDKRLSPVPECPACQN